MWCDVKLIWNVLFIGKDNHNLVTLKSSIWVSHFQAWEVYLQSQLIGELLRLLKFCSNSSLRVTVSYHNSLEFILFIDILISVFIQWLWAYDCKFLRQTFSFSFLIQFRANAPTNVFLPLYMYLHMCIYVYACLCLFMYAYVYACVYMCVCLGILLTESSFSFLVWCRTIYLYHSCIA